MISLYQHQFTVYKYYLWIKIFWEYHQCFATLKSLKIAVSEESYPTSHNLSHPFSKCFPFSFSVFTCWFLKLAFSSPFTWIKHFFFCLYKYFFQILTQFSYTFMRTGQKHVVPKMQLNEVDGNVMEINASLCWLIFAFNCHLDFLLSFIRSTPFKI